MFVINTRNGACPSYYRYNQWFNHVWGSLLSRLPTEIFNALRYYGLSNFARRMGTDRVPMALGLIDVLKFDWSKTFVRDGFVSYNFPAGEVYDLSEEVVQARRIVGNVDEVPTLVTLEPSLSHFVLMCLVLTWYRSGKIMTTVVGRRGVVAKPSVRRSIMALTLTRRLRRTYFGSKLMTLGVLQKRQYSPRVPRFQP